MIDTYEEIDHAERVRGLAELAQAVIVALGGLAILAGVGIGVYGTVMAVKAKADGQQIAIAAAAGAIAAGGAALLFGSLWMVIALVRMIAAQTAQVFRLDLERQRQIRRQQQGAQQSAQMAELARMSRHPTPPAS